VGGPRGGAVYTFLGVGATEHFPGRRKADVIGCDQGPKAGVGRPRSLGLTGEPLLFHLPSRSDTISHLSDIAIRQGRAIHWDPAREKVIDDKEANERLKRPMRKPWKI